MKSGWKTTEFWLAIITAIIATLNEELGLNLPTQEIAWAAAVIIAYILSRTVVKYRVNGAAGK